ncbi:MAG: hypothetical protein R3B06_14745 [Kofleriaceae bacterium]
MLTLSQIVATLALAGAAAAPLGCKKQETAPAPPVTAPKPAAAPPPIAPQVARPPASAPVVLPIAANNLSMAGTSSFRDLSLAADGTVTVGDKVVGVLTADGKLTKDGQVVAALDGDGNLTLPTYPDVPPVRIDPDGTILVDGDVAMTMSDDGKIYTRNKKTGELEENYLAIYEGPPEGRRASAVLLATMMMAVTPSPAPPTERGPTPAPSAP